jgi:two-component system response regulator
LLALLINATCYRQACYSYLFYLILIVLLIVESALGDRHLIERALDAFPYMQEIRWADSNESLIANLVAPVDCHYAKYHDDPTEDTVPDLILLSLDLPNDGAWDMLQYLKAHRQFSSIPVVALGQSPKVAEVQRSYDLGATSFIPKPKSEKGWVDLIDVLGQYWFTTVELPKAPMHRKKL